MNYSIDDKGAMIGTMSHFFKIVGSYPTDLKHHRKAPTIVALSDFFKTAGSNHNYLCYFLSFDLLLS